MEGLASPAHLLIIFAILILLFGAKKLPDLAEGHGFEHQRVSQERQR